MKHYLVILFCCFLFTLPVKAQKYSISGEVKLTSDHYATGASVFIVNTSHQSIVNEFGKYVISGLNPGEYKVAVHYLGYKVAPQLVLIEDESLALDFNLTALSQTLKELVIEDEQLTANISRLNAVEGAAIYEAKKTEVISMQGITANLATNNSRQIYAKVPGLNIWENDYAGIQLALGVRGLDPNRTSNFNVRQNGYDISADALGYPESYYTPPAEAVERIEIVRGAASLQYGTQFGGLLNFKLKEGSEDKPFEFTSRQTAGSFGFFNSFNSVGGEVGKLNYYSFYQHKRGSGWRPNSDFNLDTWYTHLALQVNEKLKITGQYTFMYYLAQQPGGLTDNEFERNPRFSKRERNWFQVNWNLLALMIDYKINSRLKLNIRNFGLLGGRDALGNLERIDRPDHAGPRNLFSDDFKNFGNETRLVWHYNLGNNTNVVLIGSRYYQGFTHRQQGLANEGLGPDFYFLNPRKLEDSNFDFPGNNFSLFAENIFNLGQQWSITPGIRFEHINTSADGYYTSSTLVPDPDTGFARDSTFQVLEQRENSRSFLFSGVGVSYKKKNGLEFYGNFSQNFRSINFNDIRVNNDNIQVDPNIGDERGFNLDVGVRGNKNDFYNFDVSVFMLHYNDRIGNVLKRDENFRAYRLRSNIGNSRHYGIEAFGQLNLFKLVDISGASLNWFGNVSIINARYAEANEQAIEGKLVEMTPPFMIRSGLELKWGGLQSSLLYNYVQEHFSDASNANYVPSAVEGLIPSYQVMDFSLRYNYKKWLLETGVNNLTNNYYFTRRASGYPGPGIIPADGRNFYLTLGVKIN